MIDAVEANKLCYLRCLVTKEILQLKSARFHLGDCQLWLEQRPNRYDFVIASGVLYHMQDPVRFLEAVAARTDAVFIWTHYADDEAMPPGDPRRGAFVGEPEIRHHMGIDIHLHPRSYLGAWKDKAFCGGMHDLHRWIDKKDLLAFLGALGFDDIRIWNDEPNHASARLSRCSRAVRFRRPRFPKRAECARGEPAPAVQPRHGTGAALAGHRPFAGIQARPSGSPERRLLSLVWHVSLCDPVCRPILIFERQDGQGSPIETDALLAGASFGAQRATIFVPAGTTGIRFSTCDAPGRFGFRSGGGALDFRLRSLPAWIVEPAACRASCLWRAADRARG